MHFIWMLIIGGVIGAIAGAITKTSMGLIANILAGIVGSYIGEALLGSWGPHAAGMAILPSIVGAIGLVAVVTLVMTKSSSRRA